jgi:hypothetical protein
MMTFGIDEGNFLDSVRVQAIWKKKKETKLSMDQNVNVVNEHSLRLQVLVGPIKRDQSVATTNQTDNLFVRLTPTTAQRLRTLAVADFSTQSRRKQHEKSRCWYINSEPQSSRCASGIEFLPLALTFVSTGEVTYASYNGGNLDVAQYQRSTTDNSDRHEGEFEALRFLSVRQL